MSDRPSARMVIDGAGSMWWCSVCHTTTVPPCADWPGLVDGFKEHITSREHLTAVGMEWAVEMWSDKENQ
jgi:hypothetical protein